MNMEFRFKATMQKDAESQISASSDEFPCLDIFLPILQNEYEQEKFRSERIDNKAIALLTAIIALITVYVPIYPFEKLACFYSRTWECLTLPLVLSFFLLLGFVALCIAIHCTAKLTEIYKPTHYQAVNISLLNSNEKLGVNPPYTFQLELIDHYHSIIIANSQINSSKSDKLSQQFKKAILIFILLSISAIGTLTCISI